MIALHNNYHGDTLGAMDCAASSPYNGPMQTPWYKCRGLFLEPPYLSITDGKWRVELPQWLQQSSDGDDESQSSGPSGLVSSASVGGNVDDGQMMWPNREAAFCPARDRYGLV